MAQRTASTGPAKDRVITSFPRALFPESSPYKQFNFNAKVNAQRAAPSLQRAAKVVIVGDIAVGKTCLVNRFCRDSFGMDYKATIGVDFEVEKFTILSIPYSLHLWDTAGHERFKCIAASYYRGAHVVIVVFDMSNIASMKSVKQWKDDAATNAQTDVKDQLTFLVGSKKDLVANNVCAEVEREALALASEMNAEYWSVSSKSGENVKDLFFRIVALSFDQTLSRELEIYRDEPSSKKIGSDLIKVRQSTREEEDAWKKMKTRMKCCK